MASAAAINGISKAAELPGVHRGRIGHSEAVIRQELANPHNQPLGDLPSAGHLLSTEPDTGSHGRFSAGKARKSPGVFLEDMWCYGAFLALRSPRAGLGPI